MSRLSLPEQYVGLPAAPMPADVVEHAEQTQRNFDAIALKGLAAGGEAWRAPTLTSGNNFGIGYNSVGYWADGFGVVHLRGLWQAAAGAPLAARIFVLPVGYRPVGRELYGVNASGAMGRVDVETSGAVSVLAGSTAAGNFFTLDGLTFRAA